MSPQFFTFDNKKLFASSNLGRDKMAIVEFNPKTGKEERVLFENDKYDVTGLSFSERDMKLIAASYTGEKQQYHFFDEEYADMYEKFQARFPDLEVFLTSKNKAEDKFIIRTYGDKSLGAYYLYDRNSGEISDIGD